MRIIFFLMMSFAVSALAHTEFQSSSIFPKQWKMLGSVFPEDMNAMMKELSHLDIDVAGVDVEKKIIDVLLTDSDYITLKEMGLFVELMEVKGVSKGPDEKYKTPEEIATIVNDFHTNYPHLAQKKSIGKSLEGRDIWAIKISDNVETKEDEPVILFNSMHHAREIMTPEVAIDIIEYLLTRYDQDPQVKAWVDNNEIWVLPMFNVDGNNMMWTKDKWWRKNTRGGYGVDINRNYPLNWNKCSGSSGSQSSQQYRGAAAGSEPETQAMMKFVGDIKPVFNISYHSYSEIVIYPYGCDGERVATKEIVETIGREIGSKINYKAGTAWELLYSVDGGDIDWMYDAYQVIPYVIEVNSRSQGFQPDYDQWRDKTIVRNRPGWQHLLNKLQESAIRGKIELNGEKVVIEVITNGKKVQTYRVQDDGSFHIVVKPGTYDLNIKFENGIAKTKSVKVGSEIVKVEI